MSATVFRWFDADQQLIRITVSDRGPAHLEETEGQTWRSTVTDARLEHHAEYGDAVATARLAVLQEHPKYALDPEVIGPRDH